MPKTPNKTTSANKLDPIFYNAKALREKASQLNEPDLTDLSPITYPSYKEIMALLGNERGLLNAGAFGAYQQIITQELGQHKIEITHTVAWFNELPPKELEIWGMKYLVQFQKREGMEAIQRLKLIVGATVKDGLVRELKKIELVADVYQSGPTIKNAIPNVRTEESRMTFFRWPYKDTLILVDRTNSPYVDLFGKGGSGKTTVAYNFVSLALHFDRWIYGNLRPSEKYRKKAPRSKWYVIKKLSDLFIDTPEIPSILRVHIKNAERLLEGYQTEIGAIIVFDEAKMGEESKVRSYEGNFNATFLQLKRHLGCGVIYIGVQEQQTYMEKNFLNVKIQCFEKRLGTFDMFANEKKEYYFDYATPGHPDEGRVWEIPSAEDTGIRPPPLGPDVAIPIDFDIDVAAMFKVIGDAPTGEDLSTEEITKFIEKMEKYVVKAANYARRKQNLELIYHKQVENEEDRLINPSTESVPDEENEIEEASEEDEESEEPIPENENNEGESPERSIDSFLPSQ